MKYPEQFYFSILGMGDKVCFMKKIDSFCENGHMWICMEVTKRGKPDPTKSIGIWQQKGFQKYFDGGHWKIIDKAV
jgi:hypothetical protein